MIETRNATNTSVRPSKKSKKQDRSSRQSHCSPRRHCHVVGSSSQALLETIFGASTPFSKFVHTNLDGPSRHMFKATNISSLIDSAVELAARSLLIAKIVRE